jgi:hypothetical protein
MDTRTPEQLAAAGITIRVDERGKRHITMRADPFVMLRGGPRTVRCACGAEHTFTESGPTEGWVPPHPGVRGWTCPACRGSLAPLRLGGVRG